MKFPDTSAQVRIECIEYPSLYMDIEKTTDHEQIFRLDQFTQSNGIKANTTINRHIRQDDEDLTRGSWLGVNTPARSTCQC